MTDADTFTPREVRAMLRRAVRKAAARTEAKAAELRAGLLVAAAGGLGADVVLKALGVPSPDAGPQPAPPAPAGTTYTGDMAALLLAAVQEAEHAIAEGDDAQPVLDALHALRDDPGELHDLLNGTVEKAFDESKHPRGDNGRFVSKKDIAEAQTDPAKAEQLKQRVTDPEQRRKLDAALGDTSGAFVPAKEHAKRQTAAKRERVRADRHEAQRLAQKIRDDHNTGRPVSADDLHALIPHLSQMSHDELSSVRTQLFRMGASFGGTRRLQDRANKLSEWARGAALDARMSEQGFTDAERDAGKRVVGAAGVEEVKSPADEAAGFDTNPEPEYLDAGKHQPAPEPGLYESAPERELPKYAIGTTHRAISGTVHASSRSDLNAGRRAAEKEAAQAEGGRVVSLDRGRFMAVSPIVPKPGTVPDAAGRDAFATHLSKRLDDTLDGLQGSKGWSELGAGGTIRNHAREAIMYLRAGRGPGGETLTPQGYDRLRSTVERQLLELGKMKEATERAVEPEAPKPAEKPAKAPRATKAPAKVPDVSALEKKPLADHQHLNALVAAETDPDTKDYLGNAAHNVPRDRETLAPGNRRHRTIERLAAEYRNATNDGKPQAADNIAKVIEQFGGRLADDKGKVVSLDASVHGGNGIGRGGEYAPAGLFTGDPVRVVRPAVYGPNGDLAIKAHVEPAGSTARVPRGAGSGPDDANPTEAEIAAASRPYVPKAPPATAPAPATAPTGDDPWVKSGADRIRALSGSGTADPGAVHDALRNYARNATHLATPTGQKVDQLAREHIARMTPDQQRQLADLHRADAKRTGEVAPAVKDLLDKYEPAEHERARTEVAEKLGRVQGLSDAQRAEFAQRIRDVRGDNASAITDAAYNVLREAVQTGRAAPTGGGGNNPPGVPAADQGAVSAERLPDGRSLSGHETRMLLGEQRHADGTTSRRVLQRANAPLPEGEPSWKGPTVPAYRWVTEDGRASGPWFVSRSAHDDSAYKEAIENEKQIDRKQNPPAPQPRAPEQKKYGSDKTRATEKQIDYARKLLRDKGFGDKNMHSQFKRLGASMRERSGSVQDWLRGMTSAEISSVIAQLEG